MSNAFITCFVCLPVGLLGHSKALHLSILTSNKLVAWTRNKNTTWIKMETSKDSSSGTKFIAVVHIQHYYMSGVC